MRIRISLNDDEEKGPADEEGRRITKDSFDTSRAPKRRRVDANRI